MPTSSEPTILNPDLTPSQGELTEALCFKHGDGPGNLDWGHQLSLRFGYFTPDDFYESIVARLVEPGCAWVDIGCGRALFPRNPRLARILAERCGLLVGVDPDDTLNENGVVHQREQCAIESFRSDRRFDLVTLRMVAEHMTQPDLVVDSIARLTRPGSKVLVYTVNRWSPVSITARIVPFRLHHVIKRVLWKTEERDTFPVAYRMNTRRCLARLFKSHGFSEYYFAYLDHCSVFCRFRALQYLELTLRTALRSFGLKYPENCLLGVYERT